MDEDDLRATIDRAREALEEDPGLSNRATELRVVLPLLKALGWEIHGPDVAVDVEVGAAGADGHRPGDGGGTDPGGGGSDEDAESAKDAESADEDEGPDEDAEGPDEDDASADPGDDGTPGGDDGETAGGDGDGATGERVTVDYALTVDGDPAVLVETGAATDDLGDGTVERLSAALTAAEVDLGLATNGRSFAFLARRDGGIERAGATLPDLAEDPSPLSHYTRPAAERRRRRQRRDRRRAVADDLSDGRDGTVETVGGALSEAAGTDLDGELGAAAEAFVDRVVDALSTGDHPETAVTGTGSGTDAPDAVTGTRAGTTGDRPGSGDDGPGDRRSDDGPGDRGSDDGTGSGPPGSGDGSGTSAAGAAGSGHGGGRGASDGPVMAGDRATEENGTGNHGGGEDDGGEGDGGEGDGTDGDGGTGEDGEYVVRFFSDRASVGAVGHGTHAGAMAQAVDYLIDRHALGNRLRVPWGPEDADDRAILDRRPVHPDGTEMTEAAELSEGYYLYTDLPAPASRQVVERLASKAGLRVMFQGDWADREA